MSTESQMDLDLSDDTRDIIAGLNAFVVAEVLPRHNDNEDVFEEPRFLFDDTGRYSKTVLDLRREVRVASSKAGYYHLFTPEVLGGGGQGAVAWYAVWEDLHHRY